MPKLVLLPGMDGTGELFKDFIAALPKGIETQAVRYPCDRNLSYAELTGFVRSAAPASEPFVLLAESFSTPLAIQYAATNPPNLKGLVICAGFVTSPVRGWQRYVASFLASVMFWIPLPALAAKLFLAGPNASPSLLAAVRSAVSSVQPKVLSARVRAILACDARAELSQIDVPILYIQAAQDRLVGASCLAEIQKIKSLASVTTIAGPHLLLQREPRRTADVVARFLQQPVCP
jgi:pimeloyl-ACP methyl ester carboxylesterase